MSADTVDVVLALLLITYAVIGYRQGFVVSVLSLVGFLAGGAVGMWLLPFVLAAWGSVDQNELWRSILLILGVFLLASLGQALAVAVGSRVRRRLKVRPVRVVDSVLGAIATTLVVSVMAWFIAGALRAGAPAPLARAIGASRILQTVDQMVPPQTAQLFAGFRAVLDREGFPRVFAGLRNEPITPVQTPDGAITATAGVARAAPSVVKITGLAEACNRGQEGSGWVVAPERVVTNAHVVAAMDAPRVQVGGVGRSYASRVVVFDPERDLAVLRVPDLPAPVLQLGADLARGDSAVVAGFPKDGPYRLDAARVRQTLNARGADIYGDPGAVREVYSLYARVEPGNSGGPLLSPRGQVVGVVFAKSLDDDSTGYALTLDEAAPILNAAARASTAVDTGPCAVG